MPMRRHERFLNQQSLQPGYKFGSEHGAADNQCGKQCKRHKWAAVRQQPAFAVSPIAEHAATASTIGPGKIQTGYRAGLARICRTPPKLPSRTATPPRRTSSASLPQTSRARPAADNCPTYRIWRRQLAEAEAIVTIFKRRQTIRAGIRARRARRFSNCWQRFKPAGRKAAIQRIRCRLF